MPEKTILVTGDCIIDRHIYEDPSGCCTTIAEQQGGALLLQKLLEAASIRGGEKLFSVHCGVNTKMSEAFPQSLSLWTSHQPKEKAARKAWDFNRTLGQSNGIKQSMPKNLTLTFAPAHVLLINDAGLYFRHGNNRHLWPTQIVDQKASAAEHIVLAMGAPLVHGDLWRELSGNYRAKLIVIVSLADILKEESGIATGISWERTLEELTFELQNNGAISDLLKCAHLIVRIGDAGALWVDHTKNACEFTAVIEPTSLDSGKCKERSEADLCFAAAVAYRLMHGEGKDIPMAIRAGLKSIRDFEDLGYVQNDTAHPSFPYKEIAESINSQLPGVVNVAVPASSKESDHSWSIMGEEMSNNLGIARRVALFGPRALGAIPYSLFGKLTVVDRSEIESLCGIRQLMRGYVNQKKTERPLSIAVFGAPGSGKSFGIKQIAKEILGSDCSILEFNLSQFAGPEELIGAFHQVRDKVLEGTVPLVFWDEFDSKQYKWLQYLLAPMQDGKFQEGQITHPIGKCIFVFAGGTSYTMENFPPSPENKDAAANFKLVKGPDYVSRLNGYLNVIGPNPRQRFDQAKQEWINDELRPDRCYPIRRALLIRAMLGIDPKQSLEIDPGMLTALLEIDCYKHGARSLETVINLTRKGLPTLRRSNLPPAEQLSLHVDYAKFMALVKRDLSFRMNAEGLAEGIHRNFIALSKKQGTPVEYDMEFDLLPPDIKASNVAAAARIPVVLSLAGLKVESTRTVPKANEKEISKIINDHIEILAEAEHNGWMEEKIRNGWNYAPARNNELKHHHLIVSYKHLSEEEKEKDRDSVRNYPKIVKGAGYVVVKGMRKP